MKLIKENITLIFTIIVICIVFWFGRSCGKQIASRNDLKPSTDTFIVHKVDTIKPLPEIKWYALKPQIRVDTFLKPIYLDSTECNRINVYEDTIDTKDYTLYSKKHVQGILRFDTIGVKLKVPLMIYDTVRMTIKRDSLIIKPNKYEFHVGLLASPKMIAPKIGLSIDKNTFSIGYDPFNKMPIIDYSFRLWRSKK